ncbi:MAG: IS66 family insertion sequence element accessory protein TnpB [Candidatus Atribacteria bacterium]|nr:MAG: IS66 family insertion sequence element accessory protein TnpB [Candidatus Atribacteria bacterium]
MFSLTSSFRYYLYRSPTDMRKSFDGLSGLVQDQLKRNATSGEVFIFINRRRNKVKLLRWEQGGFILYYKRLDSGTFELPRFTGDAVSCQMSWSTLMLMVEGISIEKSKKRKRYFLNNPADFS